MGSLNEPSGIIDPEEIFKRVLMRLICESLITITIKDKVWL